MNNKEVFDFLNSDTDFLPMLAVKQLWKKESFSYLGTPRPNHGLLLLTEGRIEFRSKDTTLFAYPGDTIFLPKNSNYQVIPSTGSGAARDYLVNFDTKTDCCTLNSPVRIIQNSSFNVENLFRQLVESKLHPNYSPLKMKGQFYLLLDAVINLDNNIASPEHRQIIHKAQELLQEDENLSIADIAKLCCTSERSLRRLFGESMGISPSKYRISIKLNKAKHLLESSDLSISEIADILHFFDSAYFCKTFSKHEGLTPRAYRENTRL